MDLEQRVRALEQEIEILKNQIQRTLLDIQENLLTNTYPSLRSEANTPAKTNGASPQPAEPPLMDVTPNRVYATNGQVQQTVAPLPMPITEESPRPVRVEARRTANSATPPRNAPQAMPTDTESLEQWARKQIEKNGIEQTRYLIGQYADSGRFSPRAQDYLLDYIEQYSQTSRAHESAHRPRVHDTTPQAARQRPESQPKKHAPQQATPTPPKHEEGESRNLVLRLIAGVYNASANTKRAGKHG